MTTKRKNNISYNEIRSLAEDWSLDNRNNLPYSGESVQAFIKKMFGTKAGEFYFDSVTSKYLVFANANDRDLYLSDREEHADLLLGIFDAPANYTAEINVTTPPSTVILAGTTGNYIDFTFDIKNKTGSSTGESVIVTYSFNNGGNIRKAIQVYNAGTNVHFLIDQYITEGTNSIAIIVTGRNNLASTMASVTYNVVNLQLTSSFDFSKSVKTSEYFSVPYTLKGSGIKYVEWYIDGVDIDNTDTIPELQVNRTKNIDISNLTEGKHNLQIRAYITNNGNNYYSKTLYFDFVVSPTDGIFVTDQTYVLLGLVINNIVTTTINVTLTQYEEFSYKASVFDSRDRDLNLIITDNVTQVQSISAPSETIQNLTYMPITTGLHTIGFTADEATASLSASVQDSGLGIDEVTDGLALKLSAKGRSNNETNPAIWTSGNIETTFNNFEWNNKCGWNDGTLIIPSGSSIDISYAPFDGVPTQNGRTFEIDFETTNIEDENADILSLINTNTNAGITIKPNTAKFQSAGGTNINTRFRDGDRLHLTFIINKTTGDDSRFMYIVNNGIVERAARFAATDNFNVSTLLHIGSTGCTIKLYSIKVYNKALTVDEAFKNYAVESNDIVEVVSNNDIINDSTGLIDADKVNAKIPIMIITGDISSILSISDKSHKNDWNTYPVDIEYRNMQNPELNFFIDAADIRLQGTSSISYPRKNFRIYSKPKSGKYDTKLYSPTHSNEDLIANGKYAFKENSAPVSCWCLKADYAESSGSHNVGVAKLWNSVMKNTNNNGNYILRTNAQTWAAANEYPYDVRTTIDGFPIVLFQRDSINSPLVCLGQYNFNNDKSTEDVFGFTALSKEGVTPFDNSHVECWEVLDSDNSIALFTDVSNFDANWDDAFEARYPDKNTNVTALKNVCQFLNSCYDSVNDTVDVTTWRAGKANHFDLNKLAAYYIYLLRFGAVDQTVKNAMFTTEDGQHWFYINYDNDTILGIDNESRQFDTWDYGLFTQTPQGGYYYAGKGKSVLWRLFEADSECMTLARQIDALLFNAGLTYDAVCEMFDNEQSGQWCERIYNENGRYKYITQAIEGKNVLHMLQGSRKSHRHWWLQHRFEKYDNAFGNGTYSIRSIQARATGTVNIPQGAAYKYIPAVTTYFGYAVASTIVDAPTERTAGTEYTATGLPQATGVGNLIYIYNANNIGSIDLSAYISALGSLNVGDAKDVNGNSRLAKLILGNGTDTNVYLTAISGLQDIISIEEIDIRGYQAITNIDLATLINLNTFKAENSGLTSFVPADGTTLNNVSLPATLQNITLNNTSVNTLSYTPTKTLSSVILNKVSGDWDEKSFINNWLALFTDSELSDISLTLNDINWTGMTAAQVIKMGKVGTKKYKGKVTLSSMNQQDFDSIVEIFGKNVFNPNSQFVIDAPAGIYLSGPTMLRDGEQGQFVATAFPATENDPLYYLYNTSGTQITNSNTDEGGFYYYTGSGNAMIKLYRDSGVVIVGNTLSSDVTLKIRARVNGATTTWSEFITLQCQKLVMPTVTISGEDYIVRIGSYDFPFTLGTYNAELQRIEVSLTAPSSVATVGLSGNKAVINMLTIQDGDAYTLRISAICKQGTVYAEKLIDISDSLYIMDSTSNPEVLAICYAQGWCANADKMKESEALNVTNIGNVFQSKSITHFEEFQYFKNVTRIGNYAFQYSNLRTITIPDSVTSIGNRAFYNCYRLTSITIGNSVTSIGEGAFYGCSDLTSVTIGNGVTIIGNQAFQSCSKLTSVTIGNGVISIGNSAFSSCSGLTSITIPNNVTSIGNYAFAGCSNLTSVTIGNGVTSIGTSIFQNCNLLTSIVVENGNNKYDSRNNCNAIIETASNKLILGIKTTIIPDSVTSIGKAAFSSCSGLTSVTIPDSVTSIGYQAFYGCSKLTSITIPDSVTIIDREAFYYCNKLTSVTFGSGLTSIGQGAFSDCTAITSITIPDSVTIIDQDAFYYCNKLTSVTFGSGLTSIGQGAFLSCYSLTSITIPDSVTSIGKAAFSGCSNLTSVTIGNGVTSIGSVAFSACYKVETITCLRSSAPLVQSDTFGSSSSDYTGKNVTGTKTLYVPAGATGYNQYAWFTLQATDKCNFVLSATL